MTRLARLWRLVRPVDTVERACFLVLLALCVTALVLAPLYIVLALMSWLKGVPVDPDNLPAALGAVILLVVLGCAIQWLVRKWIEAGKESDDATPEH